MADVEKLAPEERARVLAAELAEWQDLQPARDAMQRTFKFDNFEQAWTFMSRVAIHAEKTYHHPEWCNVYNTVTVTWSTHDCGGLSERDVAMAQLCDRAFEVLTSGPL